MTEHKWQPGDECETYGGFPCRIVGYRKVRGLVWEYCENGEWWLADGLCPSKHYRPKPPLRTVDRWCHWNGLSVVMADNVPAYLASKLRFTIGDDGKPAYAVQLDADGEPMYEVKEVKRD